MSGRRVASALAQPTVAGVDGDGRLRPQLDDDRGSRQAHVALGSDGALGSLGPDAAIRRAGFCACSADPGDA